MKETVSVDILSSSKICVSWLFFILILRCLAYRVVAGRPCSVALNFGAID